ncbi:unnamed protein product, partial [Ixodes persulcatus]
DTGTAAYSNPVDRTLEAGRRSRRRGRETARLPKPVRPHHTQHGETSWVQRPALRGPRLPVGPCTTTAATTRRHPQSRTRPPDREAAHAGGRAPARRRIPDGHGAVSPQHGRGHFAEVLARVWRPLSSHAARSAVRPTGAIVLPIRMLFPADRAVALESGQPFCFEEIRRCVGDRQSRTYH